MIRTLVIDDDFRVNAIHCAYVGRVPGFEVAGQQSTVAGSVEAVRALRPDLLLLDVYLPDGSGLDVLRTLTADPDGGRPDALVITAARDVASVRAAMQLGATGYLVKPFGFAALSERLAGYRELRTRMAALDPAAENGQAEVDALFSAARPAALPALPAKGHSAPTLSVVLAAVRAEPGDLSASQVATRTGVSRATAQRYLSYLVREGLVALELRYGATGRPEHRYRFTARPSI
ncbi:response regulator of citrate/malate metabolism [Kitasatospora sp. MAA4]|uniref:response regulator transcription factor n=1 Tax=Kitasatospora sp. MAA4 TaxID=3035093 RepID=UPI002475CA82|nr:response regulator [Kitasatospora sp. MAA4]MDH6133319.1 response regulator of citrate/malate metabolism [Kitasatospora sp. MAA4]